VTYTIECPSCEEPIREAEPEEVSALMPWLSSDNLWGLTDHPSPRVILCPACGWFDIIANVKGYKRWYATVKTILDLVAAENNREEAAP
jgi:hypothetical protein